MQEIVFISMPVEEFKELIRMAVVEIIFENAKPATEEPDKLNLITRTELKQILGISSDATVIKYERKGILKPHRLGRKIFYKKGEVEQSFKQFKRI